MKLTTILLLGATALAVPAFAADNTAAQSQTAANTMTPVADASATTTNQAATNGSAALPATDADTSSNTASNGQMAANTGTPSAGAGGSADTSALSSVPDTQKKYKRSSRAADFQKEAETTRQLNQQVASAGGLPKTQ